MMYICSVTPKVGNKSNKNILDVRHPDAGQPTFNIKEKIRNWEKLDRKQASHNR